MNENRIIEKISIDKIVPNIYQPRIKFDKKRIEDLAKSIKKHGVIQPIILRKIGDNYEIIDGERRYKASKQLNLKTIPSIILDISEKDAAEIMLIEDIEKEKFNCIEEANAYQQLMLLNNINSEELSNKLNKNVKYIESKLKLLTLHPIIQEALLNNEISEGHAKVLLRIKKKDNQKKLFNKIIKERITVKKLEEIIKEEEKKETNKMNNSQMNFNQYNNLLKEQEQPQMSNMDKPQGIINNNSIPSGNDFFPSLEEQPLNMNVPVSDNTQPLTNEISASPVNTENNFQPGSIPNMDSSVNNFGNNLTSMPNVAQNQNNMEPNQASIPANPLFEVPNQAINTNSVPTENSISPFNNLENNSSNNVQPIDQQMNSFTTQPEISNNVSSIPAPSENMNQQVNNAIPQFGIANDISNVPNEVTMQQPVNNPLEMPSFEFPSQQNDTNNSNLNLNNESINNKDLSLAVNLIKGLIPILEQSGYKIEFKDEKINDEIMVSLKIK